MSLNATGSTPSTPRRLCIDDNTVIGQKPDADKNIPKRDSVVNNTFVHFHLGLVQHFHTNSTAPNSPYEGKEGTIDPGSSAVTSQPHTNICTKLMDTAYTTLSRPLVSVYNFSARVLSYPVEFTKSSIASVQALPVRLYTGALQMVNNQLKSVEDTGKKAV